MNVLVQHHFSAAAPKIHLNGAARPRASLDGEALPSWLAFDPETMTFSGRPTQVGEFQVSIRDTLSDRTMMTLLLRAKRAPSSSAEAAEFGSPEQAMDSVNTVGAQSWDSASSSTFSRSLGPPVGNPHPLGPLILGMVPDQSAAVSKPFGFQVPEGVTTDTGVTFTASLADGSPLPSWLKFDAKQRAFTGTPPQEMELGISLKGSRLFGGSAKTGFLLTVGSGGSKPFVAGQLPEMTATAGQLFTGVIPRSVISDPDGDILAFSLSSEEGKLPDWLHFDPNLMIVSGVPDKEQQLELTVTGKDKDGHFASTPLQLRVQEGIFLT